MPYLVDSAKVLWMTLTSAFRKPTTVHFPAESRPRPERSRVSFALVHDENDEEACIGCMLCQKICPSDIITVTAAKKRESPVTGKKRGYADDFTLDLNACIYCELCVQVCPTDAILMTKVHEVPAFSREGLVLTMDMLYANEVEGTLSWGTSKKLLEMQSPTRGQEPVKKPVKKVVKKAVAKPAPRAEAKADAPKPGDKPGEETTADAKPGDKPAEEAKADAPKPADKPADEPAAKVETPEPAEEPAEKTTKKTTEELAEEPVEKTEEEPES